MGRLGRRGWQELSGGCRGHGLEPWCDGCDVQAGVREEGLHSATLFFGRGRKEVRRKWDGWVGGGRWGSVKSTYRTWQ